MTQDPTRLRWRTGAKVHRTVYAQLGPDPDYRDPAEGGDPLIGLFDTAELATEAVQAHNERLDQTTHDNP